MTKSVFSTRKSEILRSKHVTDLVRHLDDPRRGRTDRDAYLGTPKAGALVLAISVHESHMRGDPELRRCAEALALIE